MSNVVPIKGHARFAANTRQSAKRTLKKAAKAKLSDVLVLGWDKGGDFFIAGHPNNPGDALYLMEIGRQMLTGLR